MATAELTLTRLQQSSFIGRVSMFIDLLKINGRGFGMFVAITSGKSPEELRTWSLSPDFEKHLEDYVELWSQLTDAKKASYTKKCSNHITWLRKPSQLEIREGLTDDKFPCSQIGAGLYVLTEYTSNAEVIGFKNFVKKVADQGQVHSIEHLKNLVEVWQSLKVETKIQIALSDKEAEKCLETI